MRLVNHILLFQFPRVKDLNFDESLIMICDALLELWWRDREKKSNKQPQNDYKIVIYGRVENLINSLFSDIFVCYILYLFVILWLIFHIRNVGCSENSMHVFIQITVWLPYDEFKCPNQLFNPEVRERRKENK